MWWMIGKWEGGKKKKKKRKEGRETGLLPSFPQIDQLDGVFG